MRRGSQYAVGRSGRAVIRGEEIDRFEMRLGEQPGAEVRGLPPGRAMPLNALPAGSRLNAATGEFTWSPAAASSAPTTCCSCAGSTGRRVARIEVRIILHAKGSGHTGPQVVIDTPVREQDVGQPFMLAGWAADLDSEPAPASTTLHVWAYPTSGRRRSSSARRRMARRGPMSPPCTATGSGRAATA